MSCISQQPGLQHRRMTQPVGQLGDIRKYPLHKSVKNNSRHTHELDIVRETNNPHFYGNSLYYIHKNIKMTTHYHPLQKPRKRRMASTARPAGLHNVTCQISICNHKPRHSSLAPTRVLPTSVCMRLPIIQRPCRVG